MNVPASDPPLTITRACRFAAVPIDARQHTMNARRLFRYLEIKVHHLIQERDWASIRVTGEYDRGCVISANEKNDKPFNWQRPTAEIHGDGLVIKCFPGMDYVRHYALIIATYLNMTGRYRSQVHYQLPGEPLCRAAAGARRRCVRGRSRRPRLGTQPPRRHQLVDAGPRLRVAAR